MQKDLAAARERELSAAAGETVPAEVEETSQPPKISTLKLFIIVTAILAAVAILLMILGYAKIAGSVFGTGMLILIIFSAFRNPPSLRKDPGHGGNIDFGNRA